MSEAIATPATITPRRALAYFFYLAESHCHNAAKVAARPATTGTAFSLT